MDVRQLLRVTAGMLRDGPMPFLLARRAIRDFGAVQRTWELQSLVALVRRMKPAVIVEIGTYKGGTLACWLAVAPSDAHVISIDMPPAGERDAIARSMARVRSTAKHSQRLTMISGDSHDANTLARVEQALAGAAVNVLWIDGDHTYEGVSKDVAMYGPLVRTGGIIALHDIHHSDLLPGERSDVYWAEVKARSRTREFIGRPEPGAGMGIGVVFVD